VSHLAQASNNPCCSKGWSGRWVFNERSYTWSEREHEARESLMSSDLIASYEQKKQELYVHEIRTCDMNMSTIIYMLMRPRRAQQ